MTGEGESHPRKNPPPRELAHKSRKDARPSVKHVQVHIKRISLYEARAHRMKLGAHIYCPYPAKI